MPSQKLIAYIPVLLDIETDGEGYEENLKSALRSLSTHSFSCASGQYFYKHKKTKIKDILIKPKNKLQ